MSATFLLPLWSTRTGVHILQVDPQREHSSHEVDPELREDAVPGRELVRGAAGQGRCAPSGQEWWYEPAPVRREARRLVRRRRRDDPGDGSGGHNAAGTAAGRPRGGRASGGDAVGAERQRAGGV